MSLPFKYLRLKSGGVYHLVMKVPVDLQSVLDRKVIKRSLKTSNLQDATILLNTHLSKLKSSFTLLRTGVLDADQIIALKASLVPCKPLENKTNTSLHSTGSKRSSVKCLIILSAIIESTFWSSKPIPE